MWREKLLEVSKAVAPLIISICALQFTVVHAPLELFVRFLVGSFLAAIGMVLLFVGIDLGIVPMGRFIGAELPKKRSLLLILAVAFSIGFATTIPEPERRGCCRHPSSLRSRSASARLLAGRSAVSDGFGVVGFASIGPIIAILAMGWLRS